MRSIKDVLAKGEPDELIEGMAFCDYLAVPAASGSILLPDDPLHMRESYESDVATTEEMTIGSEFDNLVTDHCVRTFRDGGDFEDAVQSWEDEALVFRGDRRTKAWKEFKEEHGVEEALRPQQADQCIEMARCMLACPRAREYVVAPGVAQPSMFVDELGIRMKGRIDWTIDRVIVDFKTTASTSRSKFTTRGLSNTMFSFGYHTKLAFYQRWWKRLTNVHKECVLIWVEAKPPYDVAVMPLPDVLLSLACDRAEKKLEMLRKCIENDTFPGIAGGEDVAPEIPSWEMDELEFQEVA